MYTLEQLSSRNQERIKECLPEGSQFIGAESRDGFVFATFMKDGKFERFSFKGSQQGVRKVYDVDKYANCKVQAFVSYHGQVFFAAEGSPMYRRYKIKYRMIDAV